MELRSGKMVTPRPNPNEEPSSGGNVVVSQTVDGSSSTVSAISTTSSGPIMRHVR